MSDRNYTTVDLVIDGEDAEDIRSGLVVEDFSIGFEGTSAVCVFCGERVDSDVHQEDCPNGPAGAVS